MPAPPALQRVSQKAREQGKPLGPIDKGFDKLAAMIGGGGGGGGGGGRKKSKGGKGSGGGGDDFSDGSGAWGAGGGKARPGERAESSPPSEPSPHTLRFFSIFLPSVFNPCTLTMVHP